MKSFPFILAILLSCLPSNLFAQEIPASQLIFIVEDGDSLAYDSLNLKEPYYGFTVEKYPDSAIMRKTYYQNGHYRKITNYHPNGKVRSVEYFKRNGNETGNFKSVYANDHKFLSFREYFFPPNRTSP